MHCLVVYCHPVAESYAASLRDTVVSALERSGHGVDLLDLYAEGFDPVMPAAERRRYNTMTLTDHPFPDHARRLQAAEAIVFVYPTWWYGQPAMLKGWLERVWTPGLAFRIPQEGGPMEPLLTQVRLLGLITTYGAPRWWIWLVGGPGKRTILRGMRALCARNCRRLHLAHYRMDQSTPAQRQKFLNSVKRRVARL